MGKTIIKRTYEPTEFGPIETGHETIHIIEDKPNYKYESFEEWFREKLGDKISSDRVAIEMKRIWDTARETTKEREGE